MSPFATVPQAEIPSALALTRLAQQIGASAGSAYAATLLDRGDDLARNARAATAFFALLTMAASVLPSALSGRGESA